MDTLSPVSVTVNQHAPQDDWPASLADQVWTTEEYPGLTARQVEVIKLFERAVIDRVNAPSLRLISQSLGVLSVTSSVNYIKALVKKGWLEKQPRELIFANDTNQKRFRLSLAAHVHLMQRRKGADLG